MLIGLLCVGAADARSGDNLDTIDSGDLVFVGEKALDVSKIMSAEYTNQLRTEDGLRYIDISNRKIAEIAAVPGENYPYKFYPYNGTKPDGSRYDMSKYIIVTDLESVLDGIYLNKIVINKETKVETNKEIKADGADVINTETVQYYVKVKTAYKNEFDQLRTDLSSLSKWYDFNYISDSDGSYRNTVTNIDGDEDILILRGDPTKLTDAAKFTYAKNKMASGKHSVKYHFTINLKTTEESKKPQITATHVVRESSPEDFSIAADKTKIDPGDYLTLTLKGTPLTTYYLTINPGIWLTFDKGISSPYGTVERIDDYNLKVTFGDEADKEIQYPVSADVNADSGEYYIFMSDEKQNRKSVIVDINKVERLPKIIISDDAKNGKFASGDSIRIDVDYENPKKGETADLILKPQNGVEQVLIPGLSFENGKDGRLPHVLQTRRFDAGTYALIVRTTEGKEADTAFYLGTPTIVASILSGYNDVVVKGELLSLDWYARGSPGISTDLDTNGQIRWYILGTNFAQAGNKTFEITDGTVGESAPTGHSGYTYDEDFTSGLSEGRYNIIIEHPGADNIFAFNPDTYFAPLNTITTAWGETISISSMQTANAATMLMEQLNGVKSDDLAVMLTFDVEKPWFTLTDISSIKLGGEVTISGETNYPADKTVSLTIYPASFTPSEAQNNAMSMKAYVEGKTKDSGKYNKREFSLSLSGTDTWYPGTYVGYFALPDRDIVRSVSFIVGTDGDITSPDITIDTSLPDAYDYTGTVPTPEPTALPQPSIQPTALPIPTTPAPQSCIPILGMVSAFAAAAVILRRMS